MDISSKKREERPDFVNLVEHEFKLANQPNEIVISKQKVEPLSIDGHKRKKIKI